jgi:hypothetical protein
MRRPAPLLLAFLLLVGCQVPSNPNSDMGTEAEVPPKAEEARSPAEDIPSSFDGWNVQVSVEPHTIGPLALAVGSPRAAPVSDSRPWIQHTVEFHNRGDRLVRFHDTRTSGFLRRAGRPVLLVADEGCGYGKPRKKPVEPGACLLYLDEFMVRPGATVRRTMTLFKDLRGMEPVAPGTYVWDKVIRFRLGSPNAPARTATIRLTYELFPAGG